MARKHEAAQLLRSGLSPARIAKQMGISVASIVDYLYSAIGEGHITRSDILFSIGDDVRGRVDEILQNLGNGAAQMNRWFVRDKVRASYRDVDADEAALYFDLRKPEVYMLDMYWHLYQLERFLHDYIRCTFMRGYGADWWYQGIPENIRAECAAALERDPERASEPYCYVTFIHLKDIFERRWDLFSRLLPPGPASDRRRFLSGLTRINHIRNRVMHPAKGLVPEESDFRFVREFVAFAALGEWSDSGS